MFGSNKPAYNKPKPPMKRPVTGGPTPNPQFPKPMTGGFDPMPNSSMMKPSKNQQSLDAIKRRLQG